MRQRAAEVLSKPSSHLAGERARALQPSLELLRAVGKSASLKAGGIAVGVLANQDEIAGVGDEDEAVAFPVARYLAAGGGQPCVVVVRGLDLDDTALRGMALAGTPALALSGGVEAEVGVSRALVCEFGYAEHLGPESAAYRVQKVGERDIGGTLAGRAAGSAGQSQGAKVVLCGCVKLPVRDSHQRTTSYSIDGPQI